MTTITSRRGTGVTSPEDLWLERVFIHLLEDTFTNSHEVDEWVTEAIQLCSEAQNLTMSISIAAAVELLERQVQNLLNPPPPAFILVFGP